MRLSSPASVAFALVLQGCASRGQQPVAPLPATDPGGVDSTRTYPAAQVDEQPATIPRTCTGPQYPEQLSRAGVTEGRVVFRAVVDARGRVDPATVTVVSSSDPAFVPAAQRAALSCRYRPGLIGGQAVRVFVQIPFDFKYVGRRP